MKPSSHEPANLFWTGGWDSTYRLLELVVSQGRVVQPYYVLDRERRSTPTELATVEKIKVEVAGRCRNARKLIQPTRFFEKDEIRAFPQITSAVAEPLGSQSDWSSIKPLPDFELRRSGIGSAVGVLDRMRPFKGFADALSTESLH